MILSRAASRAAPTNPTRSRRSTGLTDSIWKTARQSRTRSAAKAASSRSDMPRILRTSPSRSSCSRPATSPSAPPPWPRTQATPGNSRPPSRPTRQAPKRPPPSLRVDFADLDVAPAPQRPPASYLKRRKAMAKQLGDGHALVVATHPPKQYSNDVEYLFRPHSDFWYLTGFDEPRSVLVLHGGSGGTDLFVQPRKKEAEIWTGRRLGAERAPDTLGIDRAHSFDDLAALLPRMLKGTRVHAIADHDVATKRRVVRAAGRRLIPDVQDGRPGGPAKKPAKKPRTPHGRAHLHEMRLVKEPEELKMLKVACDLGVAAHLEAATTMRAGTPEHVVEASFAHHA